MTKCCLNAMHVELHVKAVCTRSGSQAQKAKQVCLGDSDVGSAESPTTAAKAHAAGRGGHFGAFFSQVKDAASKVQACARAAA